jgi:hypothetical protein
MHRQDEVAAVMVRDICWFRLLVMPGARLVIPWTSSITRLVSSFISWHAW